MFTLPANAVVLFFKAEQFGLFGATSTVSGYVNTKGKFVAPYQGTRHHAPKKPKHPLSEHLFPHADDAVTSSHVQPEPETTTATAIVKKPRKPVAPKPLAPEKLEALRAKVKQIIAHAKVDAQHAPQHGNVHRKLYLAQLSDLTGLPLDEYETAKKEVETLFAPKAETEKKPEAEGGAVDIAAHLKKLGMVDISIKKHPHSRQYPGGATIVRAKPKAVDFYLEGKGDTEQAALKNYLETFKDFEAAQKWKEARRQNTPEPEKKPEAEDKDEPEKKIGWGRLPLPEPIKNEKEPWEMTAEEYAVAKKRDTLQLLNHLGMTDVAQKVAAAKNRTSETDKEYYRLRYEAQAAGKPVADLAFDEDSDLDPKAKPKTLIAEFPKGNGGGGSGGKGGNGGNSGKGDGGDSEQPQETGPFGPIFRQFHHDAPGAIAHLKQQKTGEAVAALYHPEVGDIDLVWGKEGTAAKDYEDGHGLAKIITKHPEVLNNLQGILNGLTVNKKGANRIRLSSDKHHAIVRLQWDGAAKTWLLTAYEEDEVTGADTRTGAIRTKEEARSSASDKATLPPPAPERKSKKEPWQMTRAEYVRSQIDGSSSLANARENTPHNAHLEENRIRKIAENRHEATTTIAVATGQPVPDHVLADYPDLKPKPKTLIAEFPKGNGGGSGNGGSGNGEEDESGEPPDRISEEELNRRGQRVRQYADQVKAGTAEHSGLRVGTIGNDAAQRIADKLNLPADGALEVVIANAVIHATNEHPDMAGDDWTRLPRLTNQFDDVAKGRPGIDSKTTRIIIKKVFPDGAGYGAVLEFAAGRRGKRLNLVTYFKGKGKSLEAWWNQNELGLGSTAISNSTESSSKEHSFIPKPDATLPPPAPERKAEPVKPEVADEDRKTEQAYALAKTLAGEQGKKNIRGFLGKQTSRTIGTVTLDGEKYPIVLKLRSSTGIVKIDLVIGKKHAGITLVSDNSTLAHGMGALLTALKEGATFTLDDQAEKAEQAAAKVAAREAKQHQTSLTEMRQFRAEQRGNQSLNEEPWDENDLLVHEKIKKLQSRQFKTHGNELSIKRLSQELTADPRKWAAGDGVGWKVERTQINRGFRIVKIYPDTKEALIQQVADTGLTTSGGNNDRITNQRIHVSALVRDNKYTKSFPARARILFLKAA